MGDSVALMRARLVVGDMLQRLGDVTESVRLTIGVNAWASENGPTTLLARSHLVLSALMENAGDVSGALDHAVRAMDVLDETTPARDRGNYLLRLADALALNGSIEQSRARYDEAEALFARIGDRERRLNVLNNRAFLEYEARNATEALEAAERLYATSSRDELNPACADSIARARLAAGDLAGAEAAVRLGFELRDEQGDIQALTPAELGLTLSEIHIAQGRLDDAERSLDMCFDVCRDRDLHGFRVEALRVRAALLAARGDYRRAFETHTEYHETWVALRSRQQEAAARTRQALFETAEARRDADRFRELARTDPLTGLPNRRQVNEDLPRRISEASAAGILLAVVLVDVDHFKSVNDEFSHQTGDEVLGALGGLLAGALAERGAPWEMAARLGGEEFLVVMAVRSSADAMARADALRAAIADHEWTVLPQGRGVTISAGVTLAMPSDNQTSLLARADMLLYRAKRAGRNRVAGDGDGAGGPAERRDTTF